MYTVVFSTEESGYTIIEMHTENVAGGGGGGGGNKSFQKFRGASNISLLTFQKSREGARVAPLKCSHA